MCSCSREADAIPLNGHSGGVYVLFLWAYVATDVAICGAFVSQYLCFVDEETCVGSLDVPDSLEKTS